MPFAATWMDLEIIILSEVRQRQISYNITYIQNLKYDTNGLIYKTETHSQTQKTNLWLPKGKRGKDKLGVCVGICIYTHTHTYTHIYVYIHIFIYVCITESLCCTPETQHCKLTILQ